MNEYLDTLVASQTAFAGWFEMELAMQKGYVPTLNHRKRRSRKLIDILIALGYRVYVPGLK